MAARPRFHSRAMGNYNAAALTTPMVEQLVSKGGLVCGPYTLRAQNTDGRLERWDLYLEGSPFRSHLTIARLVEVASHLRAACLQGWV